MKTVICQKCGSETNAIDYKKRGIVSLLLAFPMFAITMVIAYGTIMPFISLLLFVIIGLFLIRKKDRFVYVCNKCAIKIDTNGAKLLKNKAK